MIIRETLINADTQESFSDACYDSILAERGAVYRYGLTEYGRCTGKVFVDGPDGPRHVGWTFLKRDGYDGDPRNGTYLREAWVTIEDSRIGSEWTTRS